MRVLSPLGSTKPHSCFYPHSLNQAVYQGSKKLQWYRQCRSEDPLDEGEGLELVDDGSTPLAEGATSMISPIHAGSVLGEEKREHSPQEVSLRDNFRFVNLKREVNHASCDAQPFAPRPIQPKPSRFYGPQDGAAQRQESKHP
jgi:hypothetical protein